MDYAYFKAQYSRMDDGELMDVGLLPELMPQARLALDEELQLRGISDIESHRAEAERQGQAQEEFRQERIGRSDGVRKGMLRFGCALGLLVVAFGIYLRVFSGVQADRNDGELLIILGVAIIPLVFLATWISHLWRTKILYRS